MMKNATRTSGVFCILYTEWYMVSFKKGRAAKEILLCLDGKYYEEMEGNSGSHPDNRMSWRLQSVSGRAQCSKSETGRQCTGGGDRHAGQILQTIDDSVSAYNQSQEGDPIVVKKFNVTDGKAELYMNYAASRDYQDFNNVTFYAGDLQGAYNQKYEFPDEFQKVENGKVTGSVTRSDILSGLNYNVVICSEEMDIEVPGKILYVTTDAVVTGKKTATSISEEREKAAESETETASESESTDGGSKFDGNAEKGQFEVESESKSAAGNEASDTADDAEEVKHTLTFVIYE